MTVASLGSRLHVTWDPSGKQTLYSFASCPVRPQVHCSALWLQQGLGCLSGSRQTHYIPHDPLLARLSLLLPIQGWLLLPERLQADL